MERTGPAASRAGRALIAGGQELTGEPERGKAIPLQNAVDLGREAHFQGAGLLDLMKVLLAV